MADQSDVKADTSASALGTPNKADDAEVKLATVSDAEMKQAKVSDAEIKVAKVSDDAELKVGKITETKNQKRRSSGSGKVHSFSDLKTTSSSEFKKKKRKDAHHDHHNSHSVTFTINVAMAIPTGKSGSGRSVVGRSLSAGRSRDNFRPVTIKEDPEHTRGDDDIQPDVKEMMKNQKRVFEAPRAQNYYHIEYYLLPNEDNLTKTDIVSYGVAAKIYMERHDAKVIKTWVDGEITWVAWANSHTLTVTKDILLQMFSHRLEVRVWDTKDKVSTRARFDRPKAFRLPQAKPGEDADKVGGVKVSVLKQLSNFIKQQPKKSVNVRPLPAIITYPRDSMLRKRVEELESLSPAGLLKATSFLLSEELKERKRLQKSENEMNEEYGQNQQQETTTNQTPLLHPDSAAMPNVLRAVQNKNVDPQVDSEHSNRNSLSPSSPRRTFSRLGHLAGADRQSISPGKDSKMSRSSKKSTKSSVNRPSTRANSNVKSGDSENSLNTKPSRKKMKEQAAAHAAEQIKKNGICNVSIRMAKLFAGLRSLTGRLNEAIMGIEDMLVTISLDGPLMSDTQRRELNPMIITINSALNLPSSPMTYDELKLKCHPVYCKYKFYKGPQHSTRSKEHEANIYWDDINVVLLGTMEPSMLREYLNGPGMTIEVHDRDRKQEEVQLKATLFGDDLEDEKISNVGTVASRRTLHYPFAGRDQPWDPYGVAKLNFSELLLGHHHIYVNIPVHKCLIPDVLGQDGKHDGKLIGISGAVDGPVDQPLLAGDYFYSNTTIKVKVQVAYPLITRAQLAAKEDLISTHECPFGRIVFIFDYNNVQLLHKLQDIISSINAKALKLHDMPAHVVSAALSTYKLSLEQQISPTLNIITGFQVLDGSMHLYILEGLSTEAIRVLWESLPQPENTDVKVLFNSNLSFSKRLYGPLDVDLCRIKLHEPLSVITEQSLLYVRDMVPKPCFQALVNLKELILMSSLTDAVRNNIFPTSEMIVSMSREFGVPLTLDDFEVFREDSNKLPELPTDNLASRSHTSRAWTPIDHYNQTFIKRIMDRRAKPEVHNYIKDNIEDIHVVSTKNRLVHESTNPATVQVDMQPGFNYGIQTFNSSVLAKEKLRQILAEHPGSRYTYCQDYLHSMTVVPENTDFLKKAELEAMRDKWRTKNGFVYPGVKSTLLSNVHTKCPDQPRKEELTEPWKENILHVNIFQSPLDRDRFPWNYRDQDIDLYRKPQPYFGDEPITIHLAGEKKKQEKKEAQTKEQEIWQSKVVVDDVSHHVHRCLPNTEIKQQGFHSSNKLDRLEGLLKDPPAKYSLQKPKFVLNKIPALDVVLNPSVDTEARAEGRRLFPAVKGEGMEKIKGFNPGSFETRRWIFEKNKIPAIDYEHEKIIKLKGKEFNLYPKDHQYLWKGTIEPLSEPDRDNHLFQLSHSTKSFGTFEDSGFVSDLGQRSYTQPAFGTASEVTLTSTSGDLKLSAQDTKVLESVGS